MIGYFFLSTRLLYSLSFTNVERGKSFREGECPAFLPLPKNYSPTRHLKSQLYKTLSEKKKGKYSQGISDKKKEFGPSCISKFIFSHSFAGKTTEIVTNTNAGFVCIHRGINAFLLGNPEKQSSINCEPLNRVGKKKIAST